MIRKLQYEPALDGLRAVAIGIVIAAHVFPRQIRSGWLGVYIFFVLSGFLITRILTREIDATGTVQIGRFYLRRAMRLMPPLWTMLLTFLPFILLGHHLTAQLEDWGMAATYIMNFNRAFGWFPDYAFGHAWSLALEEQFYWLWPFALMLVARKSPRVFIGLLFLAVTAWRVWLFIHGASLLRIYSGPDTDSDATLMGCFLGLSTVPGWLNSVVERNGLLLLAATGIAMLTFSGDLNSSFIAEQTVGCLLGAVLVIASFGDQLGKVLSARPLVFTGKISYALYLWHFPLIVFMDARWHLKGVSTFAPVVTAYVVSTTSYFTIEAWARRAKNHLDPTRDRHTGSGENLRPA